MAKKVKVQVRRVYDTLICGDGTRVLVDRLWPRGLANVEVEVEEA